MEKFAILWSLSVIISSILFLIFFHRAKKKYKYFLKKDILKIGWILFSIIFPAINIGVSGYYCIHLFGKDHEEYEKDD